MEKLTFTELCQKETDTLKQRDHHKKQVRILTKELYNTRQRIKYVKSTEGKQPCGIMFEMFGKKRSELTPDELKKYNAAMQKKRRKNQLT